ncbi:MAG: M12 family metallo-peptidase [Candidatus Binatia bacterium]
MTKPRLITHGQASLSTALMLCMLAVAPVEARPTAPAGPPAGILHYDTVGLLSPADAATQQAKGGGALELGFHTLGRDFNLKLEPNEVYAQGATIVWVDEAGQVEEEAKDSGEFYRGRVDGDPDSWVRVQVGPSGDLAGVVATDSELYFLEPAERFLGAAAAGATVAYRLSDVDSSWEPGSCATTGDEKMSFHERIAKRREGAKPLHEILEHAVANAAAGTFDRAEIAVIADYEYYSAHGTGTASAIAQIVNAVDGIYQSELGVTVQILTTVVHTSANDPFTSSTPGTLLNELTNYYGTNRASGQAFFGADLGHLFTGRDLDGSVIGIAWLQALCSPAHGTGLSQVGFSSGLYEKTLLVAHEMGHNFGAPHDNQSGSACATTPSGYIMNPSLGSSLQQKFSDCSKSKILPHVDSSACIDTVTTGPTPPPTNTVPATPTFTRTPTRTPTPQPQNAAFIGHNVPNPMIAGQTYTVSVVMQNTGGTTWTAASNYRLGALYGNWGVSRVYLGSGESVAPGQQKTFTFTVRAPSSAGTYNFRWRMVQEGVAWFGASSNNVAVVVNGTGTGRNAAFVSQSVPSSMIAGQLYSVSVTMQNTGGTTWTAASYYRLGAQYGGWGPTRVYLGAQDSIAPGQQKTFTWTVRAPSTPGTYNFQWRMVQEGVAWFGASSTRVAVTVGGATRNAALVSQDVPSSMTAGESYTVSVTMQNTGSTTWTAADNYRLGARYGGWGTNRVLMQPGESVAPGQQKTFTWTVTAPSAPSTYDFQWQMVQEMVAWFGAVTPKVAVAVAQ